MAKKKIQIKHRFTGKVIAEMEATSLIEVVEKYKADLREANLGEANLGGANLGGANFRGANFRGANLGGANFRGADLRGADLGGANLWGAIIKITQQQDLLKSLGVIVED